MPAWQELCTACLQFFPTRRFDVPSGAKSTMLSEASAATCLRSTMAVLLMQPCAEMLQDTSTILVAVGVGTYNSTTTQARWKREEKGCGLFNIALSFFAVHRHGASALTMHLSAVLCVIVDEHRNSQIAWRNISPSVVSARSSC